MTLQKYMSFSFKCWLNKKAQIVMFFTANYKTTNFIIKKDMMLLTFPECFVIYFYLMNTI